MNREVTLEVPEELYNYAKQIAQRDQKKVGEVLTELAWTGSTVFDDEPGTIDGSNKLKQEEEAYLKMHSWLKENYFGEYIAIHNEELVDHDKSLDALGNRIYERFGNIPIWISKVREKPIEEWVFRSPQFVRVNDNDS